MQENALNYLLDRISSLERQLNEARQAPIGAVFQQKSGHYTPLPILRIERCLNGTYDVIVGGA